MSSFYKKLKKLNGISSYTYTQKNHIPITVKRKYRKKIKRGPLFAELSALFKQYSKVRERIAEKSSPRLMFRLHLVFALRLACSIVLCVTIFFTQYSSVFANAISVPREARDTAENAKIAAQAVIDAEQAVLDRLNTEEYVEDAVMLVTDFEEKVLEAEKISKQKCQEAENLRIKAQIATQDADRAAAKAAQDRAEATKAATAANRAGDYAKNVEDNAKIRIETVSRAAAEKLDELDSMEGDISERQLRAVADNALKEIEQVREETSADITAAYERADRLFEIADALAAKADQSERIADKKLDEAGLAQDLANQAEEEALSAQEMCGDLLASLREARADEQLARSELVNLIREQNKFYGSHYSSGSINYYSWSDSQGNSGYQIAKPFYYGYSQKEHSYGISTKHINSSIDSAGADGSVSALADTTLSFDKRTENEKYIFNYGLDVNLPTGKPTLSWSERNATMTEDLVEVSQFGKGWEITPRVAVNKKINKEDTLTFGTSYSFSGSYDQTSEIPNDTISPGGEWRKNLRWQHAEQDWQFVGEIIHTSSSPTKLSNGSSYPVSSSWEQRLTYNRKLNDSEDLMFYYWRESQNSAQILPTSAKEAANNYLGTMWSKKLDANANRVFRLTFDVMKSNGNHYSGMANSFDGYGYPQYNSVSVDGRTKYTIGAIYDYKINKDSKITAELQKFTMKDGESSTGKPPTNYNGVNFFLNYSRSF